MCTWMKASRWMLEPGARAGEKELFFDEQTANVFENTGAGQDAVNKNGLPKNKRGWLGARISARLPAFSRVKSRSVAQLGHVKREG